MPARPSRGSRVSDIKQVANAAGVSVATVSRVLNNRDHVKDSTRLKVQEAIETMNFRPNTIARSLRQRESRIVAVLQADNRTHFSANFADAVEDRLFESGILTIIGNTADEQKKLNTQIDTLIEMRVGGIIIRPSRQTQNLAAILRRTRQSGVATVLVESYPLDPTQFNVCFDNVQGANIAISRLLDLGHRNIGILVPFSAWQRPGPHDLRHLEFKRVASNRAPSARIHVIRRDTTDHLRFGKEETCKLLHREPAVSALIGTTDLTAAGALRAAKQLDIDVPGQLSIVSYGNSYVARYVQPTLTAVSQPIEALGRAAADILYGAMKDSSFPPRTLTIANEIKIRDSTAPI